MSLTIQLWEDSGSGPSASAEVNNLGWKSSDTAEAFPFYDYPVIRPTAPEYYTCSYTKCYYAVISGTYVNATRVRFILSGDIAGAPPAGYTGTNKVRLYYKLTSTYEEPTQVLMSGSYVNFGASPIVLAPFLSETDPGSATSFVNLLAADTTYYTCYLVTQLYVEPGAWNEFGNVGEVNLQVTVDEFEGSSF